jgi:Coenzyme PQQ synthesis protein D (PqqD)
MTLDSGSRITRSQDVQLTRTGDGAVLVDTRNGKVHVVNGSAARLWELCDEERTVEELVGMISSEYQVRNEEIGPDIQGVLETFCELQLVSVVSLSPPA